MESSANKVASKGPSFWKGVIIPFIVFLLLLVASFAVWSLSKESLQNQSKIKFDAFVQDQKLTVDNRIALYTNGLYAAQGLFNSSDTITRAEWKAFIGTINLSKNYPGLTSMSIVQRVSNADKQKLIQTIRSERTASGAAAFANFTVFPETNNPDHYVYVYIQPNESLRALGFDIGTESTRLQTLEKARDTGMPAGTGVINAITTNTKTFLIYMPVYKNGVALENIDDRRQNLTYFITAGIQVEPFFKQLFLSETTNPMLIAKSYQHRT